MKRILSILISWAGFAFAFLGGVDSRAQELDLIWERRGPGPQSRYGGTIFGLGDRNHDGFDDFAVFGWGWGEVGNPSEPVLEFFYGGDPPSDEPFYSFRGMPDQDLTIWGAYEIGDINGDDLTDWQIGYRNDDYGERWLHLYIGAIELPTEPILVLPYHYPPWDEDIGINDAGDVNGDGFEDLYICGIEQGYDHAMIWYGSSSLDTVPDWQVEGDPHYVWITNWATVQGTGDLNGDNYDDVLNYRFLNHGPFEVFWGGEFPATVSDTIGFQVHNRSTDAHITRDLNGDQRDDIAYAISISQTAVFLGGETLSPQADFMLHHGGCDGNQGGPWKVDAVGDLNGDGYNELAVTNDFCPGGRGTIWLYFNQSWLNPEPVFTLRGWDFNTWGLREAASVGDVNGDGIDDLGIGAFEDFDFRGWAGILAGNPDIHVSADDTQPAIVDQLDISVFPNPFNTATTIEISGVAGGGECDLSVYNVLGQEVVSEKLNAFAGQAKYFWNAATAATGLYIVEVKDGNQYMTTKALLLK
jgi:hypothetical protein